MVIADSESPGPMKKRPRLSLKSRLGGPKDGTNKPNGTGDKNNQEEHNAETNCDDVKTVQELSMGGEDSLMSLEEEAVVPAVASLENLGNTCFLNSILQVLRYTPRFLEGLEDLYQEIIHVEKLKKQDASDKDEASSSDTCDNSQTLDVVKYLYKLYKEMERREDKHPDIASSDVMSMALNPEKLLNSLREINPMFEGNLQHDAQELMRCILCYLQDAEKEIYKVKSYLPPRVLPPKGPTNPIMQKFLFGSKVTKCNVKGLDKTEEGKVESGKVCAKVKTEFQKSDFLDEIERSEAAKTGSYRETVDLKDSEKLFADSLNETLMEINKDDKRISEDLSSTSNTVKDSSMLENSTNSAKISKNRSGNSKTSDSRSRSNQKLDDNSEEKKTGKAAKNNKLGRNKRGRTKESEEDQEETEKRTKIENSEKSETQPNILNMLKTQVNRKRLGMRGAIIKDEPKNNSNNNAYSVERKANLLAAYGITGEKIVQKKPKVDMESPRKSNYDHSGLNESPTKMSSDKSIHPFIKLEKCDHVCDSPKKSVNANYAERTLSPMTTNVGMKTPSKMDSARKLEFNQNCSPSKHIDNKISRNAGHVLSLKNKFENSTIPSKSRQLSPSKLVKSPRKNKKDFVEKLFMGSMMLRTRCLECENSKERFEDFHDISVPLRKEKQHSESEDDKDDSDSDDESNFGLKKLMDAFTEVERLRDDNKYFCENCFRLVEAERSLHYEVLPDILTLHLKRFQASSGLFGYVSKINDHINIPILLPCLRYKCPSPCSRPDHRYKLYAVVTHAGVTLTAGHYLAYVKVIEASKLQNSQYSSISPASAKLNAELNSKSAIEKPSSIFDRRMTCTSDSLTSGRKSVAKTPFLKVPVQKYEREWLECDDETIRVYPEDKFCDLLMGEGGALLGTPYVLFYHRVTM